MDNINIKGLLRPSGDRHLSEMVPMSGDTKNATKGEIPQIIVIFEWSIPISSRMGLTKAVSAAYANSMAIIIADNRMRSKRDLGLE